MSARAAPILALLLLAPSVLALDPLGLQDDAGTGADAPDAIDAAVLIGTGEHEGTLDGIADRKDWYRFDVQALQKLRIDFEATAGRVWIRIFDENGVQVHQNFVVTQPIRYVGAEGMSYRFEVATQDPAPEGASYRFRISVVTTVQQDDAGRGVDATGFEGGTPHLAPGAYGGYLYPPGFDLVDPFTLSKPWGAWVNVTLATDGRPATLRVISHSYATQTAVSTGAPVTISTWTDVAAIHVATSEGSDPVSYTFEFHWWVPELPREENDAGLGIDAPDGFEALPVLGEGVHEGRAQFAWGDDVDHFAFSVPAGRYLDVTFTHVEGRAVFGVYKANGELVDETLLFNPGTWRLRAEAGDYVLSVHRWTNDDYNVRPLQAFYRIDANAPAVPDVAVTNLAVEPPRALVPMYKILRATVSNPGTLDVTSTVTFYVIDSTGLRSDVSTQSVNVPPGSTRDVTAGWGHLGSLGEFTIGASVWTQFDPNSDNDSLHVRAAGVVDPGLGVGVGRPVALIEGGWFGP